MKQDMPYRVIIDRKEIYDRQEIDKLVFEYDKFGYKVDLLKKGFKVPFFKYYYLSEIFFINKRYSYFIDFLNRIGEKKFYVSAPAYNMLYPIEFDVACGYKEFEDTFSFYPTIVPERVSGINQGVGYVIVYEVFLYGASLKWSFIIIEDTFTIVGVAEDAVAAFEETLGEFLLSKEEADESAGGESNRYVYDNAGYRVD